jgi:hypothetical protein
MLLNKIFENSIFSVKKSWLTLFFSVLMHTLSAQTMSFTITLWGNSIGRMDVVHIHDKDSNDIYTIESKSKAKFLWIVREGFSKFEAVYKNGKLISCSHIEIENGKTKRWTKVKYNGRQYEVESDNQAKRNFTEAPNCSDANIYFTDFKNINRIFYLPDAGFYTMKHIDGSTLEFNSSDSHRNVYHFENGKIKGMEFHLPLASVYMSRIN